MKASAYHILRVGIAITFLWISILIFKDPSSWGYYLQPWALALVPFSITTTMLSVAVLDLLIGAFLLVGIGTRWAALVASLHLATVLVGSGINAITVRDIGLLAATIALVVSSWPSQKLSQATVYKQ